MGLKGKFVALKGLYTSPRVVYCKCLPTGMTNKVYPIRQPLASLAVLASKPLTG
ncbi:MAG: hypothetical protein IJY84_03255 [Clostridia bacterium]|nr:hypothetical protein [Clostridia bacterium]